jgi:Cytochrome c
VLSLKALLLTLLLVSGERAIAGNAERGKALYFGKTTLSAQVSGADLPGQRNACVSCHRHSALGGFEADLVVPAIAGRFLFQPASPLTGHSLPWAIEQQERPAYTLDSLHEALTTGVSPAGRRLRSVMPRYQLTREDVADLSAYLSQLDGRVPPGVRDDKIYLATVITPDVQETDSQAMLATLNAFIRAKNAATRQELARSRVSARSQQQMYRNYRSWELLPWRLTGAAHTWPQQLETLFTQQPVFGMVSGMSGADWSAIHRLCESRELPCLFAQLRQVPQLTEQDTAFFNVYFHSGLATHLSVAEHWLKSKDVMHYQLQGPLPAPTQLALLNQNSAWLSDELASSVKSKGAVVALVKPQPDSSVEVSIGQESIRIADAPPAVVNARSNAWLLKNGLAHLPTRITGMALQAVTAMAEILSHADLSFSAAYCLERLEHGLESMPNYTGYERLSLAPGQRFAAKGSFVALGGSQQWTWWQP